jgi:hypothetical protein
MQRVLQHSMLDPSLLQLETLLTRLFFFLPPSLLLLLPLLLLCLGSKPVAHGVRLAAAARSTSITLISGLFRQRC